MGLFGEILSDLYSSITFTEVYAEAPPEKSEDSEEEEAQEGGEKSGEDGESSEDGPDSEAVEEGGEAEGEEGEEEAEEEEEEEKEEEEPEDIKPKLEEGMKWVWCCLIIFFNQGCRQPSPSVQFLIAISPVSLRLIPLCPYRTSSHLFLK